jgi:Domain of unknown function (DUF4157)
VNQRNDWIMVDGANVLLTKEMNLTGRRCSMPAFAQKPKSTWQPLPAHQQRLQRKWTSQPQAEELKASSGTRFEHDFSGIPARSPVAGVIQPKLTVSTPGDAYEQEADRVAEQVMRMASPRQRRTTEEQLVQRKTVGDVQGQTAPPIVHEALSSPGQPLDSATRAFMEPRFGRDFSQVRVHTNAEAARSAASIQARAYTLGNNIVFAADEYQPSTSQYQRVLAHELTHVIQQNASTSEPIVQRLANPDCDRARGLPVSDAHFSYFGICYSKSFTAVGGTPVTVEVTVDYDSYSKCSLPPGQEDFRVQLWQCGWMDSLVQDFGTVSIGSTLTGRTTLPGAGWLYGNDNYYLRVKSRSDCELKASMNIR